MSLEVLYEVWKRLRSLLCRLDLSHSQAYCGLKDVVSPVSHSPSTSRLIPSHLICFLSERPQGYRNAHLAIFDGASPINKSVKPALCLAIFAPYREVVEVSGRVGGGWMSSTH